MDPLPLTSLRLAIVTLVGLVAAGAVSGWPRSFAAEQASDVPAWLRAHVGDGDGQIAQVVLAAGARALPAKGERRHGEKSLLLRHGRDAPRRRWSAGFTSSARPTGRFARFQPVTATAAI